MGLGGAGQVPSAIAQHRARVCGPAATRVSAPSIGAAAPVASRRRSELRPNSHVAMPICAGPAAQVLDIAPASAYVAALPVLPLLPSLGAAMETKDGLITPAGVEVLGPLAAGYAEILSADALGFLAKLERRFGPTRHELLARRREIDRRLQAGEMPDFLEETR